MPLKLHVIICSTRPGRIGATVARWFTTYASAHSGFSVKLIDLNDFGLPLYDEPMHPRSRNYRNEHTKKWSASVASADAYVFVTPEYNYCPPPAFFNAVNYLYVEWNYKPCGFVSYGGISGGMRAVQIEKQLVTTVKMMPMVEGVAIPMVENLLNENRVFSSNDLIENAADVMLVELHKWAQALEPMRRGL